jgi:hypothetical protein
VGAGTGSASKDGREPFVLIVHNGNRNTASSGNNIAIDRADING